MVSPSYDEIRAQVTAIRDHLADWVPGVLGIPIPERVKTIAALSRLVADVAAAAPACTTATNREAFDIALAEAAAATDRARRHVTRGRNARIGEALDDTLTFLTKARAEALPETPTTDDQADTADDQNQPGTAGQHEEQQP